MKARSHFVMAFVLLPLLAGADLRVCRELGLHLSLNSVMAQTVHSFRGQVADQEGGAVRAARVTLSRDAKELRAAITDGEGRFVFDGIAAGRYSLEVKAAGFGVYQDEVTVGDATDGRLKISLGVATLEGELEVKGAREGLSVESGANR